MPKIRPFTNHPSIETYTGCSPTNAYVIHRRRCLLLQKSLDRSTQARLPRGVADPISAAMAIQIRTSLAEPETAATFVPHKPARPDKVEGGKRFRIVADYEPAGDQPQAIKELVEAAGE